MKYLWSSMLQLFYASMIHLKDATLEGSSQQANKDLINRRNGQSAKHLKFFFLVFSKNEVQDQLISFCNIFRIDSK